MDEPVQMPSEPPAEAALKAKPAAPPGSLWRADVTATVEEGLGYFLQRVSVEPEIVAQKFQGFRITGLRPAEFWQGVDLKPGDVVQQVNGMPIERDIDAYQVFESLRSAQQLRVSYVRGGTKREIVYAIVEPGKPGSAKPAPAAPAGAPPVKAPPPPAEKPGQKPQSSAG
jgi:S1-C subfamily serine protease